MGRKEPRQLDHEVLLAYLVQVGHALNMVCELPEWLERAPLAKHLHHAAAESFAMNCRVLVEFLWNDAVREEDVRSVDYCGANWDPGERPKDIKTPGDKHVAHMTDARIADPLVEPSYDERAGYRDELIFATAAFTDAIRYEACRERMREFVEHARTLVSWPPPPTDEKDPQAFIEAIDHLPRRAP